MGQFSGQMKSSEERQFRGVKQFIEQTEFNREVKQLGEQTEVSSGVKQLGEQKEFSSGVKQLSEQTQFGGLLQSGDQSSKECAGLDYSQHHQLIDHYQYYLEGDVEDYVDNGPQYGQAGQTGDDGVEGEEQLSISVSERLSKLIPVHPSEIPFTMTIVPRPPLSCLANSAIAPTTKPGSAIKNISPRKLGKLVTTKRNLNQGLRNEQASIAVKFREHILVRDNSDGSKQYQC